MIALRDSRPEGRRQESPAPSGIRYRGNAGERRRLRAESYNVSVHHHQRPSRTRRAELLRTIQKNRRRGVAHHFHRRELLFQEAAQLRTPGLGRVLHDGDAPVDTLLVDWIAAGRRVERTAIVPDHDVAHRPLVAVLRRRRHHVIGELPDQRVAFAVAQALDAQDVGGVGVERLAAGLFVEAHDRMHRRRPP